MAALTSGMLARGLAAYVQQGVGCGDSRPTRKAGSMPSFMHRFGAQVFGTAGSPY